MSDFIDINDQDFSFFGKSCSIQGELHLKGQTHLASTIIGKLVMEDDSELIIETQGSFSGDLQCKNLKIYGKFDGTINSKGTVTIYPCGQFSGQIIALNLVIHPGSTVNMEGKTISLS